MMQKDDSQALTKSIENLKNIVPELIKHASENPQAVATQKQGSSS